MRNWTESSQKRGQKNDFINPIDISHDGTKFYLSMHKSPFYSSTTQQLFNVKVRLKWKKYFFPIIMLDFHERLFLTDLKKNKGKIWCGLLCIRYQDRNVSFWHILNVGLSLPFPIRGLSKSRLTLCGYAWFQCDRDQMGIEMTLKIHQ